MKVRATTLGLFAFMLLLPAIAPAALAPVEADDLRLSRDTLPPANQSALVIAEPALGFNNAEAAALYDWIFDGGRVLIADDSVVGVDLTTRMGAPVRMVAARLYTPVFTVTPDRIPLQDIGLVPGLPSDMTASRPLLIIGGHDAVFMPTLTWADLNGNNRPDLNEVLAQGSILSVVDIGAGSLTILSDPDLYAREDVRLALYDFLSDFGQRQLVVDASHGPRVDSFGTNVLLTASPPRLATLALCATTALIIFLVVARPKVVRIATPRPARPRDETVRRALTELESA